MNDASEQRLTIAKRNSITYLVNSKVKAIGVAGSVARGQADAYSDIVIEKMTIAPHNLSSRLKELFRVSPHSAVHQLGELIEETFTLVETYMPEVDTTEEKKRYTLWSDKF
ncbi:MAG: hypothetical protein M3O33_08060 [Cyanobacteriota bacterium]|nr:hypothetical protein [Cyanobacteriota bacterium]